YPGVLSVGAAGPGGALAPFSDRRTPVGVIAPGVNVTSAYPGTFPDAYNPDQSGTSFAAAYVSGVVALVRAAHPRLNPAQVVARLEATARGSTGPGSGHGVIDPVRAVTADLPCAPAASPGQSSAGQPGAGPGGTTPAASAAQPGGTSRTGPGGHDTSAVTRAVIAGSFGLIVVVAVTAGLAISRRNRPPGPGPPGPPKSGRHAA